VGLQNLKISVITPSLNSSHYIKHAIESVLCQDYHNFEHIVVDGGSTDGTIDILKSYPHLHWISEPDTGQSDAMNKGFRLSTGDIIVNLNADDFFSSGAFISILPFFQRGSNFVVGKIRIMKCNGHYRIANPQANFGEMLKWWKKDVFCYNPVGYFYRRYVHETVGGFDTTNHYTMDYDFLLKARKSFNFDIIDQILGTYRWFPGTKTYETISYKYYPLKYRFCEQYLCLFDDDWVKRHFIEKEGHTKWKQIDEIVLVVKNKIIKNNFFYGIHLLLKLFIANPQSTLGYVLNAIQKRVDLPGKKSHK